MKIKNYILFFLFTTTFVTTRAQIIGPNLVQNPSFEDYSQCPFNDSQINFAYPWTAARNVAGSSDYLNFCSTSSYILYFILKNSPRSGLGCGGIFLMDNPNIYANYREYLSAKLNARLSNSKKYCCNFYTVFSAGYGAMAIENLDMFFSYNQINSYNPLMPGYWLIDSIPQIKNKNGIIVDSINWTKISGILMANGGEEYITIGNFNKDNQTNWVALDNNPSTAYYLIDDVSVCECSFDINLGEDTKLCEGDKIILNPNLPNATYTWQDSSHAATYAAKEPGTYWVRAYVAEYDITSTDTIVITAEDEKICNPPLIIPNFITPNGDNVNDNFQIGNADKYDISLQIYNRWGNLVYQTAHYTNDYNCKGCADGVYYYLLTAKSLRSGKSKDYKGSLTVFN